MRHKILFGALVLALSGVAQAQIVQYTAPGGSFAPTSTASRVTATDLTDAGSGADLQPGSAFPDTVFLQQNIASPNVAAAVANNQYFEFSVQSALGFHLNLSSLSFDASRGGSSTPRGWALRSSLDGFSTDLGTADVPTQNPTMTGFNTLLGLPFQNLASQIIFRIYGYAPSAGVGMFYDNITVNGAVQEDPVLVKYEAPGSSFAPTFVGNDVLAGSLNDSGSSADLQPGAAIADSVFLQQGVSSPTAAAAVANNQFFQFSVVAATGQTLNLSSLTFDASKGGSSDPRGWVVRSSVDNFATDLGTGIVPTQNPTFSPFGVDLSGSMFQGLSQQVTFRIYGFAPSAGVGMFYDNIALHGTTAPVPEPATILLLGAGVAAVARRRRRK